MQIKRLSFLSFAALTTVVSTLLWKPEVFYGNDFSFFEYSLSVFRLPLIFLLVLMMGMMILLSTRFGDAAYREILTWPSLTVRDLKNRILHASWQTLFICVISISLAGYEGYKLSRYGYSFLRDRFFQQYYQLTYSRCKIETEIGNLSVARNCFEQFVKNFPTNSMVQNAREKVERIDNMFKVKTALLEKGATLEKQFGVTRSGLHLRFDALAIHPWDSALRAELSDVVSRLFDVGLNALISDVQRCTAPQKSMQIPNVSRSLALVGFEHARNIGPTPIDNQAGALSERFCMMFKNLDGQQVEELLESIWQRGRMQKILAATDPNLLERTRQLKRDSLRLTSLKTERSNPDQVEPSTSLISFDVPDTSEPRLPDPMILEQKSRTGTATGTILPPGFPKIPTLKGKSPTDQQ